MNFSFLFLVFQIVLLVVFNNCLVQSTENCGLQKIKPKNLPPRENAAYPGQFPWHVAIYHRITRNQTAFACGGTLISWSFVLTADRCTRTASGEELESDEFLVQMGLHDLETTNWATFQQSAVENIFRVSKGARWAGMRNDVALLELSSRVRFSNYVQPICLGSADQFVGTSGVIAGWGLSEREDLRFLRRTSLVIERKDICLKDSGLICGESRNGTKICQNDIGGGLIARQNDDVWFLVGIATFSESDFMNYICLNRGSFTDVQIYLPWIGEITGMQFEDHLSTKTCGHRKSESQQAKWPWHGSLQRKDQVHPGESTYWCGVTLLTEQFALTINLMSVGNLDPKQFFVKFGQSSRFSQQHEIGRVFPYSRKLLDLAMIKLKTPLKFSPEIQPICLWQFDPALDKIVNRIGYLVGYGAEIFDESSENLKEFQMPIASARDCKRDHDRFTRLYVESKTFCAGLRNGTGPDYGDIGGGLFVEEGGKWFLRGVLSKMVPTNDYDMVLKTKHAIFADVTFYLNWIEATLRENV